MKLEVQLLGLANGISEIQDGSCVCKIGKIGKICLSCQS